MDSLTFQIDDNRDFRLELLPGNIQRIIVKLQAPIGLISDTSTAESLRTNTRFIPHLRNLVTQQVYYLPSGEFLPSSVIQSDDLDVVRLGSSSIEGCVLIPGQYRMEIRPYRLDTMEWIKTQSVQTKVFSVLALPWGGQSKHSKNDQSFWDHDSKLKKQVEIYPHSPNELMPLDGYPMDLDTAISLIPGEGSGKSVPGAGQSSEGPGWISYPLIQESMLVTSGPADIVGGEEHTMNLEGETPSATFQQLLQVRMSVSPDPNYIQMLLPEPRPAYYKIDIMFPRVHQRAKWGWKDPILAGTRQSIGVRLSVRNPMPDTVQSDVGRFRFRLYLEEGDVTNPQGLMFRHMPGSKEDRYFYVIPKVRDFEIAGASRGTVSEFVRLGFYTMSISTDLLKYVQNKERKRYRVRLEWLYDTKLFIPPNRCPNSDSFSLM